MRGILSFTILPDLSRGAGLKARYVELVGQAGGGIGVDDEQFQVPVCFLDGIDVEVAITAGRRDDFAAGNIELGGELQSVVAGIGDVGSGVRRVGVELVAQLAVVSPFAPAVEQIAGVRSGCGIARRFPAAAQIPDKSALVATIEQAADRVGNEQSVDQAGRLFAWVGADRIVFGGHHRHARGLAAECLLKQRLVVGIARRPIQDAAGIRNAVVQQKRIVLAAGRLHVAVVGDKTGHESEGQSSGQHILGPIVILSAGGVFAVDADRDGRQTSGGGDLGRQRGELRGKGRVGGRVVWGTGAHAVRTGGAVMIDFSGPIFFVTDFPVLDVCKGSRMIDPQEVESVVGTQGDAARRLAQ